MSIADGEATRVRGATDIVALIGEHTPLKRVGNRYVGRCPFHNEKTASFSVNPVEGLYYCFGCHVSGDAITFIRAIEGLDFPEALERLASKAGLTLLRSDDSQASSQSRKKRQKLVEAMEESKKWYHQKLLTSQEAGKARDYLRKRGFDGATVRFFELGWAPDSWDELVRSLKLTESDALATGLGFKNSRGKLQDTFRNRILFPICDSSGNTVAFGGRILPQDQSKENGHYVEPKYKNSKETDLYSKRRTLYNLHNAKRSIVQSGFAVICEGYTDVIAFHRSGITQAVATCGTAFSEEHVQGLSTFTRKLILAFDADKAGQSAAASVYAWEKRYELDIYVATLREGMDPAELGLSDPEALVESVNQAKPYLEFRVDRILENLQGATPEAKSKAARAALEVIADHPDNFVRDQYLIKVADRCAISPDLLRKELPRAGSRMEPKKSAQIGGVPTNHEIGNSGSKEPKSLQKIDLSASIANHEREALRLAIQRPADIADYLDVILFADPTYARIYRVLEESTSLDEAMDSLGPENAGVIVQLSVEESDAEPLDVSCRLIEAAAKRRLKAMEQQVRNSPAADIDEILAETSALRIAIESLRDPYFSERGALELLAFLIQPDEQGNNWTP